MKTHDRLIHMANQIATNVATEADPVAVIANHIQLFWDPRMKAMIAAGDMSGLSSTARQAVERLVTTA